MHGRRGDSRTSQSSETVTYGYCVSHKGTHNHQVAAGTLESVPEWECRSEMGGHGEQGWRLLPRASTGQLQWEEHLGVVPGP